MYKSGNNGQWVLVTASQTGRGHKKRKLVCQDRAGFYYNGDVTVLALSDGAGSRVYSHLGAELIVKESAEFIRKNFAWLFDNAANQEAGQKLRRHICYKLEEFAKENFLAYDDLAATMLVVAVRDGKYIALHIGDGVIGYIKGGIVQLLSAPNNGEFANTTVFVNSASAANEIHFYKGALETEGVQGFVLMSDGAATSLYQKQRNVFAGALNSLSRVVGILLPEELKKLVQKEYMPMLTNRTMDDCSLAIMVQSADISYAARKNCGKILKYMKKANAIVKSLQMSGIHKKYYNRYVNLLMQNKWIE